MSERFSVTLTDGQAAFLRRKRIEMENCANLMDRPDKVNWTSMFQGLVDAWMEEEGERKETEKKQHK